MRIEFQHRIRNVLSVVRSIARHTGDCSETVEDYSLKLDGRLGAYGCTLALLSRPHAGLVHLDYLIAEQLLGATINEGDRVRLEGPQIILRPGAAEPIGLAIYELAMNALQFGALSNETGKVSVSWDLETSGQDLMLRLDWQETGGPLIDVQPKRKGFGRVVLEETLPFELDATPELVFARKGMRYTVRIPYSTSRFIEDTNGG